MSYIVIKLRILSSQVLRLDSIGFFMPYVRGALGSLPTPVAAHIMRHINAVVANIRITVVYAVLSLRRNGPMTFLKTSCARVVTSRLVLG